MARTKRRMKSIARIEQERRYKTTKGKWSKKRTIGWYVQIRWNRKAYTRFFSDSKHGGRQKALDAAMAWRDATEAKIGKPETSEPVFHPNAVPNRGKGPGVSMTTKDGGPVYQIFWIDDHGRHHRTSVSIRKWGKRGARQIAEQKREEARRKFY